MYRQWISRRRYCRVQFHLLAESLVLAVVSHLICTKGNVRCLCNSFDLISKWKRKLISQWCLQFDGRSILSWSGLYTKSWSINGIKEPLRTILPSLLISPIIVFIYNNNMYNTIWIITTTSVVLASVKASHLFSGGWSRLIMYQGILLSLDKQH